MSDDKLYTVKEIADIVSVSPQSIYQKLNKQLKKYVVSEGNIKRLRESIITEYYNIPLNNNIKADSSDLNENKQNLKDNNINSSNLNNTHATILNEIKDNSSELNNIIAFFKEQIALKDTIISEKDEYIKEINNKIAELTDKLTVLLENSQQLQQNQQLLAARSADENRKVPLFLRIFRKK